MQHQCHAIKCHIIVAPKLLMCQKHWALVPPQLKSDIWKHYRKSQEVDKKPSVEYLHAMRRAIRAVSNIERSINENTGISSH